MFFLLLYVFKQKGISLKKKKIWSIFMYISLEFLLPFPIQIRQNELNQPDPDPLHWFFFYVHLAGLH